VTISHLTSRQPRGTRSLGYLIVSWAVNAIVLGIVAWIFSSVHAGTHGQLLAAAAVFGVLNTILKPLLRLITLPLAILTLGLAWFGVSMLMLWLTDLIVSGFDVDGFWTYVGATIVIWLLNVAIDYVIFDIGKSHGSSRVLPA
jgi:putative membrane protein